MKRHLWILYLALFIDMLGFGMIIPILPFFAESLGASAFTLSLLMMGYSLSQFIFAPLWGRLSDKYGRRPIIMIGLFGTALSFFLFGMSHTLFFLFASRILAGMLTAATLPTAQAYIADIISEKERTKYFGRIGAAFGMGFIFGPGLGGLLAVYGYAVPAFFASGLAVLNLIGAYFLLKESYTPGAAVKKEYKIIDIKNMWHSIKHEHIGPLIIILFLLTLGFSQLQGMYALFAEAKFNIGPKEIGIVLFVSGFVSVIVQGLLVGKIVKWFGEMKVIIFGISTLIVTYWFIAHAPTTMSLYILTAFNATGVAIATPSLSSLISEQCKKGEHGTMMGLAQSWSALARVIGPPLAGAFFGMYIGFPFYSAAVFMILALAIGLKKYQFYKKK